MLGSEWTHVNGLWGWYMATAKVPPQFSEAPLRRPQLSVVCKHDRDARTQSGAIAEQGLRHLCEINFQTAFLSRHRKMSSDDFCYHIKHNVTECYEDLTTIDALDLGSLGVILSPLFP